MLSYDSAVIYDTASYTYDGVALLVGGAGFELLREIAIENARRGFVEREDEVNSLASAFPKNRMVD